MKRTTAEGGHWWCICCVVVGGADVHWQVVGGDSRTHIMAAIVVPAVVHSQNNILMYLSYTPSEKYRTIF